MTAMLPCECSSLQPLDGRFKKGLGYPSSSTAPRISPPYFHIASDHRMELEKAWGPCQHRSTYTQGTYSLTLHGTFKCIFLIWLVDVTFTHQWNHWSVCLALCSCTCSTGVLWWWPREVTWSPHQPGQQSQWSVSLLREAHWWVGGRK